ncbi:MAG: hypothetical protein QOG04_1766 [Actinomycetota bacterium]|nr:hypothetical protein [Actinomycetota bacterium]
MTKLFSIKPSLTLKGRKFKGLRGFAGKPFHPPLTDIPIAAYILGATFDVLSWLLKDDAMALSNSDGSMNLMQSGHDLSHDLWRAGTFLFIAGLIVSVPTALTGFWDWWKSTEAHTQAWRTANWHMAVMLTTTVLVAVDILMRWNSNNDMYTAVPIMVLSVVIAGMVSFGALYGGSLVYEMGFNVETAGDSPVWHESETDVHPGQD